MIKQRISFIPGPVTPFEAVKSVNIWNRPYFRGQEFSQITLECKNEILRIFNAPDGSEVVFLASSGTGGMEASVINFALQSRKSLVINGGAFGERFCQIFNSLKRPYRQFVVPSRSDIDLERLELNDDEDLYINAHETTTGMAYDLNALAKYRGDIKSKGLFIVDGISCYLTDPISMTEQGIDALVVGSQKAFGLICGLALVVLSPKAVERILDNSEECASLYFDFRSYISNMKRGQTPFTPPVEAIMQLHGMLGYIKSVGVESLQEKAKSNATYFRDLLTKSNLPIEFYSPKMPNSLTACVVSGELKANEIVSALSQKHGIDIAPNGGQLADVVFRVAHMGYQTHQEIDLLVSALKKEVK
jgi:aspartate aminotransferase-like enzyme